MASRQKWPLTPGYAITYNALHSFPGVILLMPSPPVVECACGCGRTFSPPYDAPHKRFASTRCRNAWHQRRRQQAARLLAAAERDGTTSISEIEARAKESLDDL